MVFCCFFLTHSYLLFEREIHTNEASDNSWFLNKRSLLYFVPHIFQFHWEILRMFCMIVFFSFVYPPFIAHSRSYTFLVEFVFSFCFVLFVASFHQKHTKKKNRATYLYIVWYAIVKQRTFFPNRDRPKHKRERTWHDNNKKLNAEEEKKRARRGRQTSQCVWKLRF